MNTIEIAGVVAWAFIVISCALGYAIWLMSDDDYEED